MGFGRRHGLLSGVIRFGRKETLGEKSAGGRECRRCFWRGASYCHWVKLGAGDLAQTIGAGLLRTFWEASNSCRFVGGHGEEWQRSGKSGLATCYRQNGGQVAHRGKLSKSYLGTLRTNRV